LVRYKLDVKKDGPQKYVSQEQIEKLVLGVFNGTKEQQNAAK